MCGHTCADTPSVVMKFVAQRTTPPANRIGENYAGNPCQPPDHAVLANAIVTAGGEEFKMLAGEMSECTSRIRGGLVGWIERGQTAPMFEQAVYEADIGELVRAETHFGLHLIKVEAER